MKTKRPVGRDFTRILLRALENLGTPRSLRLYVLLQNSEWDQLVDSTIGPHQYLDTVTGIELYRRDAQAEALVRKIPWPTTYNRRRRAEDSFKLAEERCASTNHFMDWVLSGVRPQDRSLDAMRNFLHRAKKLASYILGPIPDFLHGRFGPGTVYELRGSAYSTLADKVCITPHVTPSASPYFRWGVEHTLWERARMESGLPFVAFVPGNRFTTVPKDGKTDRGICVEPSGNIWMQLAVGDVMKARLKRVGLDVARQEQLQDPVQLVRRRLSGHLPWTGQDTHRALAKIASTDGSLATIDLRNASDTVARQLVRSILPADWYELLDDLRSPKTFFKGRWVHLEKFSSMGNGFTFELETLIFACIAHASSGVTPGVDLFVYGDDIIVPTRVAPLVHNALELCGFEVNQKKSFHTGLFRESCGGDYFSGVDVRPFFVKGEPTDPLGWMDLYNGLRRSGLAPTLSWFLVHVPTKQRLCGPRHLAGVFHDERQSTWRISHTPGIRWIHCLVPQPVRIPLSRWGEWSHLLLACLGVGSTGVTPARSIAGFRACKVSIS